MQDRVKYNTKIPFSSLVPVSGSSSGDHRSPHALAPQPLVGLKILDFYITTTYSNYAGYYFALSRLLSGVCVFALSLSMFLVLSPTQTMTSHFRHQSNAALVRIFYYYGLATIFCILHPDLGVKRFTSWGGSY